MKTGFDSEFLVNKIEFLCHEAGISKTKLFTDCGLNKNVVNNLKNGSVPSVDKITIIANYFNCSIDYLLGRTDDPSIKPQSPEQHIIYRAKETPDGIVNEFIQIFEKLDFQDKIEVMNTAVSKMKKNT